MLESVSRSNINQRWLLGPWPAWHAVGFPRRVYFPRLCFPRGPPGPHEPFFIKSVLSLGSLHQGRSGTSKNGAIRTFRAEAISGMYLVVDEGLRMVTLQKVRIP